MKRARDESMPSPNSASPTPLSGLPPSGPSGPSGQPPSKRPVNGPQQGRQQGMPKVQDALGYLDKVRSRYQHQPAVYNQFLDIMKDFKSSNIDTEGVIRRVKTLFAGHRSLILGFNQFLPPGYKIECDDAPPKQSPTSPTATPIPMMMMQGDAQTPPTNRPPPPSSSVAQHNNDLQKALAQTQGGVKPTVEFNHAVNYVAKIKHRFRDQPHIYSEFLDILHDYQAKRTIEEVYTRVQRLFGHEPDLLVEFKYFLPDNGPNSTAPKPSTPVGPSKSSKSSRSAPPSSMIKSLKSGSSSYEKEKDSSKASRLVQSAQSKKIQTIQVASSTKQSSSSSKKDRSDSGQSVSSKKSKEAKAAEKAAAAAEAARPAAKPFAVAYPPNSEKELAVLDRLHAALPKHLWSQFIKLLHMFSSEIISRMELIRLVEDLLLPSQAKPGLLKETYAVTEQPHMAELFERFKTSIGYDEWEEKNNTSGPFVSYYTYIASNDFNNCPQATPSYRQLPHNLPTPYCSGRTALCESVLNDVCISIPTGSEDFSFKSTRKNIYEENLFKVEDERFELDMIIENNTSAIRVLEPIVEAAANMSPEQAKQLKIGEQLDMLHLRSIARLYGENGYEMIELLQHCPAIAAKTILARLHQKDEEWRRVRQEMKNVWRKISETNYQRSLDHRSFYFKQEDKKRRGPKALVAELKEVHAKVFELSANDEDKDDIFAGLRPGGEESVMLRQIRQGHVMAPIYTYCMHFPYGDQTVHDQVYRLICKMARTKMARTQLKVTDKELAHVQLFFLGFVNSFFGVNANKDDWDAHEKLIQEVQGMPIITEAAYSKFDEDDLEDEDVPMTEEDKNKRKRGDESETETTGGAPHNAAKASAAAARKRKGGKRPARSVRAKKPVAVMPKVSEEKVDEEEEEADDVEMDNDNPSGNQSQSQSRPSRSAEDDDRPRQSPMPTYSVSPLNMSDITARIVAADKGYAETFGPVKQAHFSMDAFKLEESLAPVRSHTRPSHLFFGSHAYYVFFRLHQFLYDRLHTAKTLAHKPRRVSSKKKTPQTGDDRFAKFVALLDSFMFGEPGNESSTGASTPNVTIDSAKFEDECRNLLGASSYVLFTLDKLLSQLLKQVLALIRSEVSLQLLSLYAYELHRSTLVKDQLTEEVSGWLCRVYSLQVSSILSPDQLTQIEYFHDSNQLGIGLVQPLAISDVLAKSNDRVLSFLVQPPDLDAVNETAQLAFYPPQDAASTDMAEYARYLDRFMKPMADTVLFEGHLLTRNVNFKQTTEDFYYRLGLTLKVCSRTLRLLYLDETADFMVRVRNRRRARISSATQARLDNIVQITHPMYDRMLAEVGGQVNPEHGSLAWTIIEDQRHSPSAGYSDDEESKSDLDVDMAADVVEASGLMSSLQQATQDEALIDAANRAQAESVGMHNNNIFSQLSQSSSHNDQTGISTAGLDALSGVSSAAMEAPTNQD